MSRSARSQPTILNIKYRPLKAFLLAADTKSFTHAADRLGVTQPSLTALIQDLETTLGLKLFERTTRSITLTNAGHDLHERIHRPITDLEETYRNMMDLAAVRSGRIVLGALPSTSLTLIPPTLGELRSKHPSLQIRVVEAHNDELIKMLRTNQVEFALAAMVNDTPDLSFTSLVKDVFCAVYQPGHPIEKLKRLTWKDLVPHDLVLLSQGSSARSLFDRSVMADESTTGLRYDVTHMTTAISLVKQGLGITLLPSIALQTLPMGNLLYRPIEGRTAERVIGLLHRRDRNLSPASNAFLEQVKTCIQDDAQSYTALIG